MPSEGTRKCVEMIAYKDGAGGLLYETVEALRPPNLQTCSREEVLEYFENTYGLYDTLFSALKDDSVYYMIPDRLRRPLIFYYGHTSVLYINKLVLANLLKPTERVNPHFEKLLETGVDEMSWDDMDNDKFNWPSVKDVAVYRRQVYDVVVNLLKTVEWKLPITWDSPLWAFFMGFEHDKIHFETSSVLIRQLPIDAVRKPTLWKYAPMNLEPFPGPQNSFVEVPAGQVTLGKPYDFPSYGWDNEYGHEEHDVPAFSATKFLISNGEFLPFVQSKGYEQRKYWVTEDGDDEAWRWVIYRKAKYPSFWVCAGSAEDDYSTANFKLRLMFDIVDLPWDWPVEVNAHEARAFCRWKSEQLGGTRKFRLPTEPEYHRIRASGSVDGYPDSFHGVQVDVVYRDPIPGNLNMRFGSPCPVNYFPPSAAGFYDVHGNVWEWLDDHFHALSGFRAHYLYDDFSTPCFDSFHNIIVGGSWVSTGDEASIFSRFHFRRHFFQHLGFRMVVEDENERARIANIKKVKREIDSLLLSHYQDYSQFTGDSDVLLKSVIPISVIPNYRQLVVEIAKKHAAGVKRALDLGCEVGRASFELARFCESVVGVESNEEYYRAAMIMKRHGKREYERLEEGEIVTGALALLPGDIDRTKVAFEVGNPEALRKDIGQFDIVLICALFDSLRNPRQCVQQLNDLVRSGGVVVISSCFNWNETRTPKNNWLGGFRLNGEDVYSTQLLSKSFGVGKEFECVEQLDIPVLQRRTNRNFNVSVANVSVFRRK